MSSTEPLRRHSSTAHPSVNRVDAPKHIVPKEPHKAQPVKEAADSSGKRRLINIYKLYIHFEPKKNSVYLGKVQVKRQNHLDNDLELPRDNFRFTNLTRERWGMAMGCVEDKGSWKVAYLYNKDRTTSEMKNFAKFLMKSKKSAFGLFHHPKRRRGMLVIPYDQPPIPKGLASDASAKDHLLFCKYTYDQEIVQPKRESLKPSSTVTSPENQNKISSRFVNKLIGAKRKLDESIPPGEAAWNVNAACKQFPVEKILSNQPQVEVARLYSFRNKVGSESLARVGSGSTIVWGKLQTSSSQESDLHKLSVSPAQEKEPSAQDAQEAETSATDSVQLFQIFGESMSACFI